MMKTLFTSILIVWAGLCAFGQDLYIKTFGNQKDKAIIFLHGGPGYNAANFEATTAQALADKGFFVILYDRRGEGRSNDPNANYTFEQTFNDLNVIYNQFRIRKATLIGHSFGGVVATLFTEQYPEKIKSVILVGAPMSLQETFATIIKSSRTIYENKKDSINLKYLSMLESMDKSSIQYSAYTFMHAMQNGFYSTKQPTEEAKQVYDRFLKDTLLIKQASEMSYQAPEGFWQNERYTTLDLTENLKNLMAKKIPLYGLYGKEDGLYSEEQITSLQSLIGKDNLKYLDNCSHNVFADQQTIFLTEVTIWAK